jgi:hypothetical protein
MPNRFAASVGPPRRNASLNQTGAKRRRKAYEKHSQAAWRKYQTGSDGCPTDPSVSQGFHASHASRAGDEITLDEVERIAL